MDDKLAASLLLLQTCSQPHAEEHEGHLPFTPFVLTKHQVLLRPVHRSSAINMTLPN